MSDDRTSSERIATKQTVTQMWSRKAAMNSRVGEERQSYGAQLNKAVELKFLDKKAFDIVTSLAKLESGKAARHFRNIMIYAEHLGIAAQADIEDEIAKSNPVEEATGGDGFDQGGGIKPGSVKTANPKAALKGFEKELAECKQARSAQTLLQKFVAHHQDLAEEAEKLTEARVTAIAQKKPRSPAAEAAHDAGIGTAG